jgi:hypothetical protein
MTEEDPTETYKKEFAQALTIYSEVLNLSDQARNKYYEYQLAHTKAWEKWVMACSKKEEEKK